MTTINFQRNNRFPLSIRSWLIGVACISSLAGCSTSEGDKMVGQWVIQDAGALSRKVGADDDNGAVEPKMSIRFERSGRLTTKTAIGEIDSTKKGSWKWLSFDADTKIMTIECSLQGQSTQHEIEFEDDETILWVPPNMAGTTKRIRFVNLK